MQALHEWKPETTGLVLASTGKELHNWPLHGLLCHVPATMRYLKKKANVVFGRTMTQITEKENISFKSRLQHTRRRAVGNVVGRSQDVRETQLLKSSNYFQVKTQPPHHPHQH